MTFSILVRLVDRSLDINDVNFEKLTKPKKGNVRFEEEEKDRRRKSKRHKFSTDPEFVKELDIELLDNYSEDGIEKPNEKTTGNSNTNRAQTVQEILGNVIQFEEDIEADEMIIDENKLNPVDIVNRLEFPTERTVKLFNRCQAIVSGEITHDAADIDSMIDRMTTMQNEQREPAHQPSAQSKDINFGDSVFDTEELNRQSNRLQKRKMFFHKLKK